MSVVAGELEDAMGDLFESLVAEMYESKRLDRIKNQRLMTTLEAMLRENAQFNEALKQDVYAAQKMITIANWIKQMIFAVSDCEGLVVLSWA